MTKSEIYISCDVEADGPIPGDYSMLSLGMFVVGYNSINKDMTFYVEMKPISDNFVQEAMDVNGLDRDKLIEEALEPPEAMQKAFDWVKSRETLLGSRAVFLAAPAVWDGMFIHWYFMKFLGKSPFGVTGSGIDLRSYFMGMRNCRWNKTSKREIRKVCGMMKQEHTHNAADDAKEQALYFWYIQEYQKKKERYLHAIKDNVDWVLK